MRKNKYNFYNKELNQINSFNDDYTERFNRIDYLVDKYDMEKTVYIHITNLDNIAEDFSTIILTHERPLRHE